MNKELAIKLKENGYADRVIPHHSMNAQDSPLIEDWMFTAPNLKELIEACKPSQFDNFGLSTGYTDQWEAWATYHGHAIPEVELNVKGDSPEEAIALLWIELNKK